MSCCVDHYFNVVIRKQKIDIITDRNFIVSACIDIVRGGADYRPVFFGVSGNPERFKTFLKSERTVIATSDMAVICCSCTIRSVPICPAPASRTPSGLSASARFFNAAKKGIS